MAAEKILQIAILDRWGNHPQLRLWRVNVGVGWFANSKPACRCHHPDAYPVHFGIKGEWDVSGIIMGGRRLEIETKAPGKKLTPEQLAWGAMIRKFGGLTVPAWTVEDVDRAFAEIGITR